MLFVCTLHFNLLLFCSVLWSLFVVHMCYVFNSWKELCQPHTNPVHETMCLISSSFPTLPCCCLSACSTLPDVPHAHISEETKKTEYHEGDVIDFTCEPGYTSALTIRYVCMSEGWLTVGQGRCHCELIGFLFSSFTTNWMTTVADHVAWLQESAYTDVNCDYFIHCLPLAVQGNRWKRDCDVG